MTALPEACAALAARLPLAAALTAEPDVGGREPCHSQLGSRPPWNAAAAHALLDAHEGARRLEATLRYAVTGRPGRRRGGSTANTYLALDAVASLGHGVPEEDAHRAARYVDRLARPIDQLPPVDLLEPCQKVSGVACRYCGTQMLRLFPRSGRVTCLRYGACWDANGQHPEGLLSQSVNGEAMIAWADGTNEYAQLETTP
jgi:hypothetical protein